MAEGRGKKSRRPSHNAHMSACPDREGSSPCLSSPGSCPSRESPEKGEECVPVQAHMPQGELEKQAPGPACWGRWGLEKVFVRRIGSGGGREVRQERGETFGTQ